MTFEEEEENAFGIQGQVVVYNSSSLLEINTRILGEWIEFKVSARFFNRSICSPTVKDEMNK